MSFARCVLSFMFLCAVLGVFAFKYEDCSTQDNIFILSAFDVMPDPVDLKGNLTITAHAQVVRDIPQSAQLEVKYKAVRKVFGMQVDIPIPCLLGKFGSCTLPFCLYMKRFEKQICSFVASGISCQCPLKAGNYSGNQVEIEMPKPSLITRLLVKGKYRTEMRLKDIETGVELACYKFHTELT